MSQPSRWTPLMLAAVEGSKQCAVTLLDHGADPKRLNLVTSVTKKHPTSDTTTPRKENIR